MTGRLALVLGTSLIASLLFSAQRHAAPESIRGPILRIAEPEIDPVQLEAYELALCGLPVLSETSAIRGGTLMISRLVSPRLQASFGSNHLNCASCA
jgi:hypothetical protein